MLQGVASAGATVELTFGAYTHEKPTTVVRQLRPTLNEIARKASTILGENVKIRLEVVKTYTEGIARLAGGQFDFMRLGPASYVTAKGHNPGLDVLAMENKGGSKTFNGVICVKKDSDITEVSQLKGRSFAFGNKRSTLGRYFAQLTLFRSGVLARDLDRYEYLGRHDKVGRAVGSGLYDAGALSEPAFKKLVAKGVPLRAIAKFSNSTRPWVARAGMNERVKDALRAALLRFTDRKALKALRFDGFLPGEDSEYDATREAIEVNPQFFAKPS